ncbi:MAG: DUF2782 domain-containing protein [Gammaproteobacteria bacterium]|nr:DUF2782 domain-containing protein [Gammaproteobacteria bacterium]MYD80724.1 DUF2782 domain-containing protein [Gammaproteobacteria bacterium]
MTRFLNQVRSICLTILAVFALLNSPTSLAEEGSKNKKEKVKGPDVVLTESKTRSIQEYRQNGKLTMIKVVPKKGKPYYMVPEDPTKHFGDLERAERLVPKWKLKEF